MRDALGAAAAGVRQPTQTLVFVLFHSIWPHGLSKFQGQSSCATLLQCVEPSIQEHRLGSQAAPPRSDAARSLFWRHARLVQGSGCVDGTLAVPELADSQPRSFFATLDPVAAVDLEIRGEDCSLFAALYQRIPSEYELEQPRRWCSVMFVSVDARWHQSIPRVGPEGTCVRPCGH